MKQTAEGQERDLNAQMDRLFGGTTATAPLRSQTIGGFGVEDEAAGYFRVTVGESVQIDELIPDHHGNLIATPRCTLTPAQWESIAPTVQTALNAGLKAEGQRQGRFLKTGGKLNRMHLGKEMLVLAWAVEGLTDSADITTARSSWLALHRVERWWLYNQTARINGRADQRGIGWRAGLMHAMTARAT